VAEGDFVRRVRRDTRPVPLDRRRHRPSDSAIRFPDDWWPYGIEANRKAIDTFLRYHFEQGLSHSNKFSAKLMQKLIYKTMEQQHIH
jgi:hypothetical protein